MSDKVISIIKNIHEMTQVEYYCLQLKYDWFSIRIGLISPFDIRLPCNDIKKWLYYKHFRNAGIIETRFLYFAFALSYNDKVA